MPGGKAHGANRKYQLTCRDVLCCERPELTPWAGDGIDVSFELLDGSTWSIDVALRKPDGGLVVAECKRTKGAVKQTAVAAFAYIVERLRQTLNIPVAGFFFTKTSHQIGAIKVGEHNKMGIVVLAENAMPPAFDLTFHRHDKVRARKLLDLIKGVPFGSLALEGLAPDALIRKRTES